MVYYLKAFQLLNCICNLLLCYAALCGLLSSVVVEGILNNINISYYSRNSSKVYSSRTTDIKHQEWFMIIVFTIFVVIVICENW